MIGVKFTSVRWEYLMRVVLLAAVMFGTVSCAQAADMPDYLRGSVEPAPTVNWRGFYVGGQGAWASSAQTFTGSTMDRSVFPKMISGNVINEIAGITAPTPVGTTGKGSTGYGAFTGHNWQWDDAVLGLEMSYLHGGFGGSVSAIRQFASSSALSDGLFHDPKVTSTSTIEITDYATFRARAAYAYNCFLPYAFGGFALGYANVLSSVRIDDFVGANAGGPFSGLPPLSGTSTGENHLIYGYTAGLGIDINLIGGLFMRAEWEYVRFTAQVDTNINTVRAGLGYKF
jgi:outer membrane immunogenic protein